MATREKSERNAAAASYLRGIKGSLLERVTYEEIAERTEIKLDTVKRLMTNRKVITMDEFLLIAEALGVDDTTALSALAEIRRK